MKSSVIIVIIIGLLLSVSCSQTSKDAPYLYSSADDLTIEYNEDSIIKAIGGFSDEKRDGKWLYFDDSGELLREINYREGVVHGILTEYRQGKVFFVMPYVDGKKAGLYRSYNYICGTLASEGYFKNDQMDGLWYEYYKGMLIEINQYNDGKQIQALYKHPNIDLSELPPFPDGECFTSPGDKDLPSGANL